MIFNIKLPDAAVDKIKELSLEDLRPTSVAKTRDEFRLEASHSILAEIDKIPDGKTKKLLTELLSHKIALYDPSTEETKLQRIPNRIVQIEERLSRGRYSKNIENLLTELDGHIGYLSSRLEANQSHGPSAPEKGRKLDDPKIDDIKNRCKSIGERIITLSSPSRLGRSGSLSSRGGYDRGASIDAKYDILVDAAYQAGFRDKNLTLAVAIAASESGLNFDDIYDTSRETSYGPWQINLDVHMGKLKEELRAEGISTSGKIDRYALDPERNARLAFKVSGGSNFSPWSDYKNGKYANYLDSAKEAVARFQASRP